MPGRDRLLAHGAPFLLRCSSNSGRRPRLFDWTGDPAAATVDTVVYMGPAILKGLDAPGRKIAWLAESPAIDAWQGTIGRIEAAFDQVVDAYDVVLSSDRTFCARHPRIRYHPAGSNLPWIPESRYGLYRKDRMCSMFASRKAMVEGHLYRARVAERLADRVDVFGGAAGSRRIGGGGRHPDKSEGLLRYRFQVVLENCRADLYYTEKITDCFATGTVPVYWGAESIGEICDARGILRFDDDFDPDTLSEDLYYELLPAVRNNLDAVRTLESSDDALYRRYVARSGGVTVALHAERSREAPLGEPGALAWDPKRVLAAAARDTDTRPGALLRRARASRASEILAAREVPADRITVLPVETRMAEPASLDASDAGKEWYAQIDRAFLLHVPDAFIGDGLVFDDRHRYSFGRWWWRSGPSAYRDTERVEHVAAAVSIAAWGGEAFQHFILDAVPQLGAVLDLLLRPEMSHLRIVSHLGGRAKLASWFWDRVGLRDRVVQKPLDLADRFVVHADLALAVQFEPNLDRLGLYPREVLRPVQRRLGLLEPSERDLVLYLGRSGVRSVRGEAELLGRLRRELAGSGLELRTVRGLDDWDRAMELMRRARVVVGPHGGAFANLLFAQPGTQVVELVPRELQLRTGARCLAMYWGLAQAAGHHYWRVEPTYFDFDGPGMVVDPDEVAGVLRLALESPA